MEPVTAMVGSMVVPEGEELRRSRIGAARTTPNRKGPATLSKADRVIQYLESQVKLSTLRITGAPYSAPPLKTRRLLRMCTSPRA